MKHDITKHHICAKSRGGAINDPSNIVFLKENIHIALHILLGNGLPHEQIGRMMYINSTALTQEFKNDVKDILKETDRDYYYQRGILLKK